MTRNRATSQSSPDNCTPVKVAVAPRYGALSSLRRNRDRRGGASLCSLSVEVAVVTPILGGAHRTRTVDSIDVIRAPSVRGQLRFWWRALYGHEYATPEELYLAESTLWGRAATDDGGRSAVSLWIEVIGSSAALDRTDLARNVKGLYALWPALENKKKGTPAAPLLRPGTQFCLTLTAPEAEKQRLQNVLRAWLVFGGYGSRTRRGLGSFTVTKEREIWLPNAPTIEAFAQLFGANVFAPSVAPATAVAWLAGAALCVGGQTHSDGAWTAALNWLQEFRQGTGGSPGARAREPDPWKQSRPSRSNWPEGDKVRQLSVQERGLPWAHRPRHNATPAWPRAGFGLPINGQFQKSSRERGPQGKNLSWSELPESHANYGAEPKEFELRWRGDDRIEHDRLASPLIVKALPLANGQFVPCALWLTRRNPAGQVMLRGRSESAAPFDRLVASGDKALFNALSDKTTLRQAFLDWLETSARARKVML